MKFEIELSADELNELASLANELHEPMSKTGADVIRSYLRRRTQRAVDVANSWRCVCGFLVLGNLQKCDVCDTPRN